MIVRIADIRDHGLNSEFFVLTIHGETEMSEYMVIDTTYNVSGEVSNKLRHLFWFPKQEVEKGDTVILNTGKGRDHALVKEDGSGFIYIFYWGLDKPIWNNDGDCALVIHLDDLIYHKVDKNMRVFPTVRIWSDPQNDE